jgi:D-threonate/D-erythronate kinase
VLDRVAQSFGSAPIWQHFALSDWKRAIVAGRSFYAEPGADRRLRRVLSDKRGSLDAPEGDDGIRGRRGNSYPAAAMTMRVLALADDLTGALEVGAKFAERGRRACVTIRPSIEDSGVEVLVVDTETRHVPPEAAFQTVRHLAAEARALGVPLVYKKTDSTLRGNTGAELGAMLAAEHTSPLLYAPAYPAMGRTVRGGRLYVHGVPVHETAFARDPLNPVVESEIARVIASQWDGPVRCAAVPGAMAAGEIFVIDAVMDADVAAAARAVLESGCALAAGPAALAGELAAQIGGPPREASLPKLVNCLVVNGSMHEVSARQIASAVEAGWHVAGPGQPVPHGWTIIAERWDRIGESLPRLFRELAPDGLVIFGGDTAFAILKGLGCSTLDSICEVAPGVPLSRWGALHVVTKAGGFGPDSILLQLRGLLERT